MAYQICQWHLRMVHQPQDRPRSRIILQDQPSAGTQHTLHTVEKLLEIQIVMKAVGANDCIK